MDFLRHHTIQVDFDKGKLAFLKVANPAPANLGKSMPMFFGDSAIPTVAGAASLDHLGEFIIDTGATLTGGLSPKFFDELLAAGKLTTLTESKTQTVSGTTNISMGRNEFVAMREYAVMKPVMRRGDKNFLGLGFWSRFIVTFDFPGETVFLKKGRRFGEPDSHNWTGMHILRDEGNVKVHSLNVDCPAAIAGLQPGAATVRSPARQQLPRCPAGDGPASGRLAASLGGVAAGEP